MARVTPIKTAAGLDKAYARLEKLRNTPEMREFVKLSDEISRYKISKIPPAPAKEAVPDPPVPFESPNHAKMLEDGDNPNIVEEADAIGDLQYVLDGKKVTSGLYPVMEAVSFAIHQNNMRKAHRSREHAEKTIGIVEDGWSILEKEGLFLLYNADKKLTKPHDHKKVDLAPIVHSKAEVLDYTDKIVAKQIIDLLSTSGKELAIHSAKRNFEYETVRNQAVADNKLVSSIMVIDKIKFGGIKEGTPVQVLESVYYSQG